MFPSWVIQDAHRQAIRLAEHLLAMADDAYLQGHPEWGELIKEAEQLKGRE